MSAVVIPLPARRVRACDRFDSDGSSMCKCGWQMILHRIYCSACGGEFYVRSPRNVFGFSHCEDHS